MLFFLPISISLFEIFAAFALLGFIGRKIIKPDFEYLQSWPNIFLLLFFLFNMLSLINSGKYLPEGASSLCRKWAQFFIIYAIVQDAVYNQKIVRRGIRVFLFSAVLTTSLGIGQILCGKDFLFNKPPDIINGGILAMTSTFPHYNSFGGYLVIALSLTCALFIADTCLGLKAVGLLALSVLLSAAIVFTFSRGSWIAISISLIFLSVFNPRRYYRLIPIFILILLLSSISIIRDRLYFIFELGGDRDRFRYWSAAFNMIKDHPFLGLGVGTFMSNFWKYLPLSHISYAHNCYLQICAETGVFGLLSFMLFIISIGYISMKKFFVSRDFLLFGLIAGMLGFLVHSFFDSHLYSFRLAALFWL